MKYVYYTLFFTIISCVFLSCGGSMTNDAVLIQIQNYMDREVQKGDTIPYGQLYIFSEKLGGEAVILSQPTEGEPITEETPFHIASIGKSFTALLIAMLVEEGAVQWDTPVSQILPPSHLQGLFVFEDVDYQSHVTVRQLLNHRSGAADYFGDSVLSGQPMAELMLSEPERIWSPQDLLDFSREYQSAVAPPGEHYHYSDTGYILLGLIVEELWGIPFYQALEDRIFTPLTMNHTSLLFYPTAKDQSMGELWFQGKNIGEYNSVSVDWAGGGILSTLHDLSLFARAIMENELISQETLSHMYSFDDRFMRGIHYGLGFMEYHFGEFFPTLNQLPIMQGHMGILGTQWMMDRESGTILIVNYASTDGAELSVKTAIRTLGLINRITEES